VKRDTNIYRVSAHCWKGFQARRSNVKVTETKEYRSTARGQRPSL